jgi:hypothetical protein
MEAKEVVQKGYDLFGAGDMETFFGEIVHNDNVLLGDTCKEIGVTRHNSDNAATVLTA